MGQFRIKLIRVNIIDWTLDFSKAFPYIKLTKWYLVLLQWTSSFITKIHWVKIYYHREKFLNPIWQQSNGMIQYDHQTPIISFDLRMISNNTL